MAVLSVPTTARLPSSLRLDSKDILVQKTIARLSRPSLLSLASSWLQEETETFSFPYLRSGDDDVDDEEDEANDFYPPAASLEELREEYADLQERKGSKKEVIDRVLDGDWRNGITLQQLAAADLQYLYDHPLSQKWSAFQIVALEAQSSREVEEGEKPKMDKQSTVIPRFHPSTFVQRLQSHVLPDVKTHYSLERPKDMALWMLRLFIVDSPYNTNLSTSTSAADATLRGLDASTIIYIAFPDASPFIYLTKPQSSGLATSTENRSLRSLIVEGIPKALSKARERYTLRATSLSTKNMAELLHRRGPGRTNAAGGGWSLYNSESQTRSPLDVSLPTPPTSENERKEEPIEKVGDGRAINPKKRAQMEEMRLTRRLKRARRAAEARFADSAKIDNGLGVDRVDIVIHDPFPGIAASAADDDEQEGDDGSGRDAGVAAGAARRRSSGRRSSLSALIASTADETVEGEVDNAAGEGWRPTVKVIFHGTHVFAGVRQLAEAGVIDATRMPGWLTGEEGVTVATVRHGRMQGHKGSGI